MSMNLINLLSTLLIFKKDFKIKIRPRNERQRVPRYGLKTPNSQNNFVKIIPTCCHLYVSGRYTPLPLVHL